MNWYFKVLRNYANFKGRARRKEFWYYMLFSYIAVVIFAEIDNLFIQNLTGENYHILNFTYRLAVLTPAIAVSVRRMHDVGESGWNILIPFYNIILAATDGDKGKNEYGPDPKNEKNHTEDLLDTNLIDE